MNAHIPRSISVAISLSLFSILFGFALGGLFGAFEDQMKGYLDRKGTESLQVAYKGDLAAKDAVVKKSWEYLKRAHLHGGGIGAAALAAILALVAVSKLNFLARLSSLFLGVGALMYSIYWLFAGLLSPSMGSTSAAKDYLDFIAVPGAAFCLLGIIGALLCVLRDGVLRKQAY